MTFAPIPISRGSDALAQAAVEFRRPAFIGTTCPFCGEAHPANVLSCPAQRSLSIRNPVRGAPGVEVGAEVGSRPFHAPTMTGGSASVTANGRPRVAEGEFHG